MQIPPNLPPSNLYGSGDPNPGTPEAQALNDANDICSKLERYQDLTPVQQTSQYYSFLDSLAPSMEDLRGLEKQISGRFAAQINPMIEILKTAYGAATSSTQPLPENINALAGPALDLQMALKELPPSSS